MRKGISIRPSKDIRTNYAKISELSKINPVAITVNGKEDIVILSHDDYLDNAAYILYLEEKIKLYENIIQAMEDIKLGRVHDSESVVKNLLAEINDFNYEE